jgi:hypothetical protein
MSKTKKKWLELDAIGNPQTALTAADIAIGPGQTRKVSEMVITVDTVQDLPTGIPPGVIAVVLGTNKVYVTNENSEWVNTVTDQVMTGPTEGTYVQGTPLLIGTGNGTNKTFPLPYTVGNETVWAGGSVQVRGVDYTVVGNNAVFTDAPENDMDIIATAALHIPVVDGYLVADSPVIIGTGNGTNTVFTLPETGLHETVWAGGSVQVRGVDYTVSGVTLTFTDAPENGMVIIAKTAASTVSNPSGAYSQSSPVIIGTGNGTNTVFTLPETGLHETVWAGGSVQVAPDDYSVSGTTLTFTDAPENGMVIIASADVLVPSGTLVGTGGSSTPPPATDAETVDGRSPGVLPGDIAFYNNDGRVVDSTMLGGKQPGIDAGDVAFYDDDGRVIDTVKFGGVTLTQLTDSIVNDLCPAEPLATNLVDGIVKLSTAPVSASDPIALGVNDNRVPSQDENDALQGTSGTPSNSNKYVTEQDIRVANNRKCVSGWTSPYSPTSITSSVYLNVPYGEQEGDPLGEWDTVNHKFIASRAGRYRFETSINVDFTGGTTLTDMHTIIKKSAVNGFWREGGHTNHYSGSGAWVSGCWVLDLVVNEEVEIQVNATFTGGTGNILGGAVGSYFRVDQIG